MLEPLGFGAAILAQVVSVLAGRVNKRDLRGPSYRIFSTNGVILALVSFLAKILRKLQPYALEWENWHFRSHDRRSRCKYAS